MVNLFMKALIAGGLVGLLGCGDDRCGNSPLYGRYLSNIDHCDSGTRNTFAADCTGELIESSDKVLVNYNGNVITGNIIYAETYTEMELKKELLDVDFGSYEYCSSTIFSLNPAHFEEVKPKVLCLMDYLSSNPDIYTASYDGKICHDFDNIWQIIDEPWSKDSCNETPERLEVKNAYANCRNQP